MGISVKRAKELIDECSDDIRALCADLDEIDTLRAANEVIKWRRNNVMLTYRIKQELEWSKLKKGVK